MPFSQAGEEAPSSAGQVLGTIRRERITTLRALLPSRAGHGAGEPRTGQTTDKPEGEEGSRSVLGEDGGQGQTLSVQFVLPTWCLE